MLPIIVERAAKDPISVDTGRKVRVADLSGWSIWRKFNKNRVIEIEVKLLQVA